MQMLTAVLGIRNILVRIRIPGSVPLTNGSDSSLVTLGCKKNIFSCNLPTGTLSSVLKV